MKEMPALEIIKEHMRGNNYFQIGPDCNQEIEGVNFDEFISACHRLNAGGLIKVKGTHPAASYLKIDCDCIWGYLVIDET